MPTDALPRHVHREIAVHGLERILQKSEHSITHSTHRRRASRRTAAWVSFARCLRSSASRSFRASRSSSRSARSSVNESRRWRPPPPRAGRDWDRRVGDATLLAVPWRDLDFERTSTERERACCFWAAVFGMPCAGILSTGVAAPLPGGEATLALPLEGKLMLSAGESWVVPIGERTPPVGVPAPTGVLGWVEEREEEERCVGRWEGRWVTFEIAFLRLDILCAIEWSTRVVFESSRASMPFSVEADE